MDGIMVFSEGEIVGKVSEFQTESEFAEAVIEELCLDKESRLNVQRVHCRWYPRAPWPLSSDFPDGAYATCPKGRGSFEVFMIQR